MYKCINDINSNILKSIKFIFLLNYLHLYILLLLDLNNLNFRSSLSGETFKFFNKNFHSIFLFLVSKYCNKILLHSLHFCIFKILIFKLKILELYENITSKLYFL